MQTEYEINNSNELIDTDQSLVKQFSYQLEMSSGETDAKSNDIDLIKYYVEKFLREQKSEMSICIRKANDPSIKLKDFEQFKNLQEKQTSTKSTLSEEMKLIEDCLSVSVSKNHLNEKKLNEYIELSIQKLIDSYSSIYYAPYSVMTQSSGYGKTRAVLLLKDKWFLVYTCLRDKSSTGFPMRSLIAETLLDWNDNEFAIERKFTNFYAFYLNKIKEFNSPQDFYDRNSDINFQKEAIKYVDQNSKQKFNLDDLDETKNCLFVFDAARELLNNLEDGQSDCLSNRFLIIRRLLKKFGSKCVFTIFIDTVSRKNNFLPSSKYDNSARVSKGGFLLFQPIYFLPTFDVFANKEEILNLKIVCSIKSICSFGRPLWSPWIQTHLLKVSTK
jgi:hypothetical protein